MYRFRWGQASRLGWPVGEQLASPIAQLILTPLLLHRIGTAQFGFWVLALTPLIASSSLSLGRSNSLMAIVPRWSDGHRLMAVRPMILRVLGLTATTSLAALVCVILIHPLLLPLLPKELDQPVLYLALVVVLVATSEAENTLSGALKGLRQFKAVALTEMLGRVVQVIVTFAVVTATSKVSTVITIAISVAIMKFALKGYALHRHLPRKHGSSISLQNEAGRDLRVAGVWMWVQVMCGLVFYSFDRWIVGYCLGAATLAAYSICTQLAQLSHALSAAASQPLIPWAATQSAAVSDQKGSSSIRRVTLVATLAACLMPALVIIFAEPLLRTWISPSFAAQHTRLARQLGLVFLLLAANVPSFNMLIGWGQTRFASMLTVAAASFFIFACIAVRPEQLDTIVAMKLGYAVIGLVSVARMFNFMRETKPAHAH